MRTTAGLLENGGHQKPEHTRKDTQQQHTSAGHTQHWTTGLFHHHAARKVQRGREVALAKACSDVSRLCAGCRPFDELAAGKPKGSHREANAKPSPHATQAHNSDETSTQQPELRRSFLPPPCHSGASTLPAFFRLFFSAFFFRLFFPAVGRVRGCWVSFRGVGLCPPWGTSLGL